jgi:hypothetical protein
MVRNLNNNTHRHRHIILKDLLYDVNKKGTNLFGEMNQISLPDISSRALEIICDYLCERRIRGVYLSNFKPFSRIDPTSKEDRELVVELLLAANYMDC